MLCRYAPAILILIPLSASAQTRDGGYFREFRGLPLGIMVAKADSITVIKVVKCDHKKKEILFRDVRRLKGRAGLRDVTHLLPSRSEPKVWLQVLRWARPGREAVAFTCASEEDHSLICLGNFWYHVYNPDLVNRAEATAVHSQYRTWVGPIQDLYRNITSLIAGREVIATGHAVQDGFHFVSRFTPLHRRDWLHSKTGTTFRYKTRIPTGKPNLFQRSEVVDMGSTTAKDIPGLLHRLKDKSPLMRSFAVEQFRAMGVSAKSALPALEKCLTDTDPFVRLYTVEALAEIAPAKPIAHRVLRQSLTSKDSRLRQATLEVAVTLKERAMPVVDLIVAQLSHADADLRGLATQVLGRIIPGTTDSKWSENRVVTAISQAIGKESEIDTQVQMLTGLQRFGAQCARVIHSLVRLDDPDQCSLLDRKATMLARMEPAITPSLLELVGVEAPWEGYSCARILAGLDLRGPLGEAMLSTALLRAETPRAQCALLRKLVELEPKTTLNQHQKLILDLTHFHRRGVGTAAIGLLSGHAGLPELLLNRLQEIAGKDNGWLQTVAARILRQSDSGSINWHLRCKRQGGTYWKYRRLDLLEEMINLPEPTPSVVPALLHLYRGPKDGLLPWYVSALIKHAPQGCWRGEQGRQRREAVEALSRIITHGYYHDGSSSTELLTMFPADREMEALEIELIRAFYQVVSPHDTRAHFQQNLESSEWWKQLPAAVIRIHLNLDDRPAANRCIDILAAHPRLIERFAATIEKLGPKAARLIPLLEEMERGESQEEWALAARLLTQIAPKRIGIWDVRRLQPLPEERNPTQAQLKQWWLALGEPDSPNAGMAQIHLILAGDKAVTFLEAQLRPAPVIPKKEMQRTIQRLSARRFSVRQKATRRLEQWGSRVEPELREMLAKKPGLEMRRRIEQLLPQLNPVQSPSRLRTLRAVRLLGHIQTKRAEKLLQRLRTGAPSTPLTAEATLAASHRTIQK